MPGAKYTETYKKVSAMGEKLKAAGKQGPSNDEQLHVRDVIQAQTHTQADNTQGEKAKLNYLSSLLFSAQWNKLN